MTTIIRDILQDLERTRENMLALSDDIWLGIDHNDPDALRAGVEFKEQYNARMSAFDRLAGEISELVQQYTQVRIDAGVEEDSSETDAERRERLIRELDAGEAHGLEEDFTFKRPCGYRLEDEVFSGQNTWRRLFEHMCRQLNTRDGARFREVTSHPDFQTRRGNRYFAPSPEGLRVAGEVVPGMFAETNLSANSLRNVTKLLLNHFGIETGSVSIFLREDRDAEPSRA